MKQIGRSSLCALAVAVATLVHAATKEYAVVYVPQTETGPWAWNTSGSWRYDWDPFKDIGRLPCEDATILDDVCIYVPALTTYPLTVPAGTVATCNLLSIGSNEKYGGGGTDAAPYLLEVCGILTNNGIAYLGYRNNDVKSARSAKVTVSSGKWVSNADVMLGGGSVPSWLNVGPTGTVEVPNSTFYVGAANRSTGVVTNMGTMAVKDLRLGNDFIYNSVGEGETVGRVANFGTMNVSSTLYIGSGKTSYGEFDNYGVLNVGGQLNLGTAATATMSIYRHHAGATLSKPVVNWKWFYVGEKAPARFIVDGGTLAFADSNERFYIGFVSAASSLEVCNGGSLSIAGPAVAGYHRQSLGRILVYGSGSVLKGTGDIHLGNAYPIVKDFTGGRGELVVSNGAEVAVSGTIFVGHNDQSTGMVLLKDGGVLRDATELRIGASPTTLGGSTGTVTVAEGAMITNVGTIAIGQTDAKNFGTLDMEGGLIVGRPGSTLIVGINGNSSVGLIRGWGTIRRELGSDRVQYLSQYAKVVADGKGVKRDLDLGNIASFSHDKTVPNAIGVNGWYAENKGRLRMPHDVQIKDSTCRCVGDYVALSVPRLANAFACDLEGVEYGHYMHADLYAADRDDIPQGLPLAEGAKVLSVYRIGYFKEHGIIGDPSTPVAFSGGRLTFRYCAQEVAAGHEKVRVYRHDGTGSGRWARVASAALNATEPLVQTASFQPSAATWNLGFFAVVAEGKSGLSVIVR